MGSSRIMSSRRCTPRGFTLIELLVVVALVALLVGLILPNLRGARETARQTVCAARIAQPGMLLRMYATDHQDRLPRLQDAAYGTVNPSYDPSVTLNKTWIDLLVERDYLQIPLNTLGITEALQCPSARNYDNDPTWAGHMPHFGANVNLAPPRHVEATAGPRSFFGRPFTYAGDHSTKIMIVESRHLTNHRGWSMVGNMNWIGMRHANNRGANVHYLDGHVSFERVPDAVSTSDPAHPFTGMRFWRQPLP